MNKINNEEEVVFQLPKWAVKGMWGSIWVGVSGWLRLGFYVCNSGLGLFIFNDWVSLAGKGPNGKVVLLWRICLDLLQHPFSQFFVHHVCIIARYFSNFLPSWFFRPTRHVLGWRWLHISELSNVQNLISISQVDNVVIVIASLLNIMFGLVYFK